MGHELKQAVRAQNPFNEEELKFCVSESGPKFLHTDVIDSL